MNDYSPFGKMQDIIRAPVGPRFLNGYSPARVHLFKDQSCGWTAFSERL